MIRAGRTVVPAAFIAVAVGVPCRQYKHQDYRENHEINRLHGDSSFLMEQL